MRYGRQAPSGVASVNASSHRGRGEGKLTAFAEDAAGNVEQTPPVMTVVAPH